MESQMSSGRAGSLEADEPVIPVAHDVSPAATPRPGSTHRRRWIAAVLTVLLVGPGVSYAQALAYPGSASWQMRSVEWFRNHGGSNVVNAAENWYYTIQPPRGSAPAPAALPVVTSQVARSLTAANGTGVRPDLRPPTALPVLTARSAVPGEGRWVPGRLSGNGVPAIYTSFLRPDPAHPSVFAGVAWMRARATYAHLVAGTVEPTGSGWSRGAHVPASDVPALVATFNSGWTLHDARGGFYLSGRGAGSLRDGQASLVIDDQGTVTLGQWGRDVTMGRHVVAVRQNLALVVDHGRPVAGLSSNVGQRWGNAKNQYQFTWRSGAGVDATGNLVYVAGADLTLTALATALADAGAVRGMELDIHTVMVSFASWAPSTGGSVTPTKLLPRMNRPADRYLASDQRDFFYLTLRST